jgi:carbonic anhydrase
MALNTAAVQPETALRVLQDGNARFTHREVSHTEAGRRPAEAAPNVAVLSCSDSRAAPEAIFDQPADRLYSVRVAGTVLSAPEVASLEYAVEKLHSKLIVILGHDDCDAVKTALGSSLGKSAGSPDLDALVSALKPGLRDKTASNAVRGNLDAVGARLLARSRIIRKRASEGDLAVVYGIYHEGSGRVDFWR